MPQTLKCPSCAAPLQYDGRTASVKCEYCNNIALIPEEYRRSDASRKHMSVGSGGQFGDSSRSVPVDELVEINDLIHNGRKIEAIKIFRNTFGVSLKEAKEAVEKLERGEAINLSGQQRIMAFHDDMDQMVVDMDRSEMVININTPGGYGMAGNVSRPVVLGGQAAERPKPGCVSAFLGQFGCLLFVFFWIPFTIMMVGIFGFPALAEATAPVLCDEGYQDAVAERVGYYSAEDFTVENGIILRCVYEAGIRETAHPAAVAGVLFGVPMAVLAVLAFVIAFLGRVGALVSTIF